MRRTGNRPLDTVLFKGQAETAKPRDMEKKRENRTPGKEAFQEGRAGCLC